MAIYYSNAWNVRRYSRYDFCGLALTLVDSPVVEDVPYAFDIDVQPERYPLRSIGRLWGHHYAQPDGA